MLLFPAFRQKSTVSGSGSLDWLLFSFSVGVVPLLILLLTVYAFVTFDDQFARNPPTKLELHTISDAEQRLTPSEATRQLAAVPAQLDSHTHLQETPFWFSFAVPANIKNDSTVIEMPSRHAQKIACWDGTRLMGTADRGHSSGLIKPLKAGFAITLGVMTLPRAIVCKGFYSGPARITVQQWPAFDADQSENEFHRGIGLLEGGLLMLTVFVLVAALINREWMYVLFAVWLFGNLRLGANSMGWDAQWVTIVLPNEWMPLLRKLTFAIYYVVTFALFSMLFKAELKQIGQAWILRIGQCLALIVFGAALLLPYAQFLLVLWSLTALGMVILVTLLLRILILTHSRVALWYSASLAVVLFATFDEVIAAAFGIRAWSGVLNSVSAALLSSLMAAFAIAEQMRVERHARVLVEAELRSTYEVTPIGLFTLDREGNFIRSNPAVEKMLGLDLLTNKMKRWSEYFEHGAWDKLQHIAAEKSAGGAEIRAAASTGNAVSDANVYLVTATVSGGRIEGSLQDATERSLAVQRLRFLAENDSLTSVLNRRGIEKMLEKSISAQSDARPLALAYLDLDRFKLINDLFGHHAGDEVLKQLCLRIKEVLHEDHDIGRIGGDEFVILLRDAGIAHATDVCRNIIQKIGIEPYHIGTRAFQVKGSIGLIEVAAKMRVQDAISAADRACREAKKAHSEHIVVYQKNAAAFQDRLDELDLIEKLGGEFLPPGLFIEMQPIMSLREPEKSLNFEVLLRLREADNSIVSATKIIAAAEENGSIATIDKWVLSSVLAWLSTHHQQLPRTRFVCVNLSGGSLNDEKFIQDIFQILERYQHIVSLLCIEITESVALHDLDHTRSFIDRLQRLGAKVALDDFGAGYTSFTYLKELSADALKIDGAFIQGMTAHPANEAIVEAIVELAHNLGMKSIAEWVEDCSVIEALSKLGVDYVQGYVVAKPQSPERILLAHSAASFIEDPALVKFIQDRSSAYSDAWDDSLTMTSPNWH